jgi:hypothetical protein
LHAEIKGKPFSLSMQIEPPVSAEWPLITQAKHQPLNQRVAGSSPGAPTIAKINRLQLIVKVSFRHAESAAVMTN